MPSAPYFCICPHTAVTERSDHSDYSLDEYSFSIAAFVILYFLLSKFAFSKLFAVMEKRRELVMQQMDEAAKTREQAVAYVEEQKQALQQARQEAQQIIQQSQATSSNQADRLYGSS